MKFLDCPRKYIGQTGRIFYITYKERIHAIRYNNSNSGYSNHTLNTGYTYRTIADTKARKELQTFEYLGKISHL
jgi:hypothetical protein